MTEFALKKLCRRNPSVTDAADEAIESASEDEMDDDENYEEEGEDAGDEEIDEDTTGLDDIGEDGEKFSHSRFACVCGSEEVIHFCCSCEEGYCENCYRLTDNAYESVGDFKCYDCNQLNVGELGESPELPLDNLSVRVLDNKIPFDIVGELYQLLQDIEIPLVGVGNTGRYGWGPHRAACLGLVMPRNFTRDGKCLRVSSYSREHRDLYEKVKRIGRLCCPEFKFTSIHLNHNVTCPPHKDRKNMGVSMLVSFGNYTGGNIVVEGDKYDSNLQPIIFNGSLLEHFNTDDLSGNKYSLVFYNA